MAKLKYKPPPRPSGIAATDDMQSIPLDVRVGMRQYLDGDLLTALRYFEDSRHPYGLIQKMRVPRQYERVEDIEFYFGRLTEAIDEFEGLDIYPCDWYDAISMYETFDLPYSGIDVTPYLVRIGKVLREKVVTKALPHLCKPIEKRKGGKVRVAYVSPHMRAHNGARWIEGWLKHRSDDIEVTLYNIGPRHWHDETSLQLARHAELYEHLQGPIHNISAHIKSREFDVIVHPAIGMSGVAYQMAALRLAPVQMTAWGHPVTSGLDTVDYYLSSDLMEPENGQDHYLENLVRLPGSGLAYPRITDGPGQKTKQDLGLPDKYLFIAQNVMKLNPQWDFLYKRVQDETGLPLAVIGGMTAGEEVIVKRRFEKVGLNTIWLPRMVRPDYLTALIGCTVSLDPPAWSGGNTTIESIHFGVPLVTLPTEFMRGRHSLCFLKQAGLERFIAKDADDYVRIASEVVKTQERIPDGAAEALYDNVEPVEALNDLFRSCKQQ